MSISQTEPLGGPCKDDDSEAQAEQPAKIEDAPAAEESAQASPDAAEAIEAEERAKSCARMGSGSAQAATVSRGFGN